MSITQGTAMVVLDAMHMLFEIWRTNQLRGTEPTHDEIDAVLDTARQKIGAHRAKMQAKIDAETRAMRQRIVGADETD